MLTGHQIVAYAAAAEAATERLRTRGFRGANINAEVLAENCLLLGISPEEAPTLVYFYSCQQAWSFPSHNGGYELYQALLGSRRLSEMRNVFVVRGRALVETARETIAKQGDRWR